jgi:hypothetical protein
MALFGSLPPPVDCGLYIDPQTIAIGIQPTQVIGGIRITLLGERAPPTVGLSEIPRLQRFQPLFELTWIDIVNKGQQQETESKADPWNDRPVVT